MMAIVSCEQSTSVEEKVKVNADIAVRGNCEMCKERIEEVALGLPGVTTATWDLGTKHLTVKMDTAKTNLQSLHTSLAKAGHGTAQVDADAAADEALPPCCRKGADMH